MSDLTDEQIAQNKRFEKAGWKLLDGMEYGGWTPKEPTNWKKEPEPKKYLAFLLKMVSLSYRRENSSLFCEMITDHLIRYPDLVKELALKEQDS